MKASGPCLSTRASIAVLSFGGSTYGSAAPGGPPPPAFGLGPKFLTYLKMIEHPPFLFKNMFMAEIN